MKLFIATKNQHKVAEFKRILEPIGIEIICESDLSFALEDVEENGLTFEENAFIKAEAAMKATGLPSVADDSGLCVDYLGGAPGIYSARYAGEPTDNDKNNKKLLDALKGVKEEERTAKFVCSIACIFPSGQKLSAYGECKGRIAEKPQGSNGFGYDPLFISDIGNFGELSDAQKDSVSHRGNALKAFYKKLSDYINEV